MTYASAPPGDPPSAGVDETSSAILDAALSAFNDFGLRRTTMDDVARRAGVARMTVYRRFAAKSELVRAVLMQETHRFLDDLADELNRYESVNDGVAEGFAFAVEYLRGHALLNRLLSTEPELMLPYLTTEAAPLLDVARKFIASRYAPGRARDADAREHEQAAAEVLVRLALSFVLTPQSVVEDVRGFARGYLVPPLLGGRVEPKPGREGESDG